MRGFIVGAGLLSAGCGGATEAPEPPLAAPNAEVPLGEWRSDYLTAGALYRKSRLRFEADGTFEASSTSGVSFTEPPVHVEFSGDYSVTEHGTVWRRWDAGEAERTLAVVSGRVLDEPHPCCSRIEGERLWTHLGYLALDPRRTRFGSRSSERSFGSDPSRGYATRVDVTFSRSPLDLSPGDECEVELSVFVEATDSGATVSRSIELTSPCSVTETTPGVIVVLTPGYDSVEGRDLLAEPFRSKAAWARLLADRAPLDGWPERLRELAETAVRPYLVLARDRPNVLFTYFDSSARIEEGYVWGTP